MRVLLASDKFKGSLDAESVARVLAEALGPLLPGATFDSCPIADGGEGTVAALIGAMGGAWREARVTDARGRPRSARYGVVPARRLAILEMSAASGLAVVGDLTPDPASASTLGTGELLLAAAAEADEVVLGIGGSATNDGGLGLARALGWRFLRMDGSPLEPTLANLTEAARLEAPHGPPPPRIRVACDVDNPLLGPRGATRVYGPQKGVRDFAWFEDRLARLADLARDHLGRDLRDIPGAGAAGGLGFGLMAFAGASLTPGFELVAETLGLEGRVRAADLVITGEGRIDSQSLSGKGPVGVARLARRLGKPVAAFCGRLEDSPGVREAFDLVVAIAPPGMSAGEAMRDAPRLLARAAADSAGHLARLRSTPG